MRVKFESGKNGTPITRVMKKVAFPPRDYKINLEKEYEVEIAGENPAGKVYFLTIIKEYGDLFPDPIECELELYSHSRFGDNGFLSIDPASNVQFIRLLHLPQMNPFIRDIDQALAPHKGKAEGTYRARVQIGGYHEYDLRYISIELLELMETAEEKQRRIYGGMTRAESEEAVKDICARYNVSITSVKWYEVDYGRVQLDPSIATNKEKFLDVFERRAHEQAEKDMTLPDIISNGSLDPPASFPQQYHYTKNRHPHNIRARSSVSLEQIRAYVIGKGGDVETLKEGYDSYDPTIDYDDDGGFTFLHWDF